MNLFLYENNDVLCGSLRRAYFIVYSKMNCTPGMSTYNFSKSFVYLLGPNTLFFLPNPDPYFVYADLNPDH